MLEIQRLNMDTSWFLRWSGLSTLIDPWLIGSEIDGFSWFNEQWHVSRPLPLDQLPKYDSIIVTQSYSDHCHENTLKELKDVPILGTPKAIKRLRKEFPGNGKELILLPDISDANWYSIGGAELAYIDPGNKMDPVYYGLVVKNGGQAVVYFPHGFHLKPDQVELLSSLEIKLLITSFSLFKLPSILGGSVNPGEENAQSLIESLNPKRIMHTHDENKHAKGFIKRIAKTKYPEYSRLISKYPDRFMYLDERYELTALD